ncbi:acyltransferase [Leeuwenhoekiella aequorea]|uniref:acyltransferase n=1 Tax=Leeuwenhoekiella aequorea TaxID=283736 RepID=UPI00352E1D87|tara:strand:+ start:1609 stop:2166 length:558 start_codon:yes stop_codon:yes gene_type:complete
MIRLLKKRIGRFFIKCVRQLPVWEQNTFFDELNANSQQATYNHYRNKYSLANSFRFNGEGIIFHGDGAICIGSNTYLGRHSYISAFINTKIQIGDNCSISHNVKIYTISNQTDQNMDSVDAKNKIIGDVLIGNGVWIGANVFIKEGVTIGNNSVVGANAVVISNVPENAIYGGVPAKLLRYKVIG